MFLFIKHTLAIFKKNFKRNLHNKKKLLLQLVFPSIISLLYFFYKKKDPQQEPLIHLVMSFLLTIYLGLINSSAIRETITLFINQRQEGSRQYQFVMGLCKRTHTIANMLYMMVYTAVSMFPFYVVLNLYQFKVIYIFIFASFIISSSFLTIALTSFFTEHKVATEVIGIFFSLAAFLSFFYVPDQRNFNHYLAMVIPNSSFSLAIMSNNDSDRFIISMTSLFMWKFYLMVFYAVQFRDDFFDSLKRYCNKCRRIFTKSPEKNQQQMLMNDIQAEVATVLYSTQAQGQDIRPATPTIELHNVKKHFGNVIAIDNVTLTLRNSEIFGLLGRNGAGKTTIVDMITKVTKPTSGHINFYKSKKDNEQLSMGICYQHQILYQDLSGLDHLKFYCQIKNVENPQEEINKIVNQVGITDELNKKVKELSGGNKRKLSLCIALLNSPKLLIFDEPTSGLDPSSRRIVWSILQNLRSLESTIILTTHHLDQADYLSDRICVIKKGKIIQQGTPAEIKEKHGRGYYLTINYNSQSGLPFDVTLCSKVVSEALPKSKLDDQNQEYLRYFVSKNDPYQNLIKCIKTLQRLDGISISLQTNSLEQSFIAINSIDSSPNSEEGVKPQDKIKVSQNSQNVNVAQSKISNCRQIRGVLLKNFYCYISRFHYFYNMNLIILIAATAINSLLLNKINSIIDTQKQIKRQDRSSPLLIVTGYIVMSSAFISIPVLEKQQKIIQLLRTRGLRIANYWLGHFIFDFLYFCINFTCMYIWFASALKDVPLWVMALTGCTMILYSYTISMLFSKVKTANSWFTILNTILGLLMMPFMMPDAVIKDTFYAKFKIVRYLFPYFDLSAVLTKKAQVAPGMPGIPGMEQVNSVQEYTVHFCFIIYVVLFIVLQSKIIQKLFIRPQNEESLQLIKLQHVTKKYGKTQALKNVTYSINNQSLALLGHNGAGKSTTFGLLSSQLNVTEGKLFIEKKMKKVYEDVMNSAGICYQEDTLWKFMTPDRIMAIFSHIVGVTDLNKQIDSMYQNMDIQRQLKNRKFQNLSGGNKRKICMAVCLLGSPQIKLLDQCSTGLDPVSRLSMTTTLNLQHTGTTVFTTHSIPEAEQVCSRAIIMKKGQVSQNDKIFKLKEKYYHCYWIELSVEEEEKFEAVALQIFNKFKRNKIKVNEKKRRVEIQKSDIKLSELMELLLSCKDKYIKDFNIDQPKFEDVYLLLTNDQQIQPMGAEISMEQFN